MINFAKTIRTMNNKKKNNKLKSKNLSNQEIFDLLNEANKQYKIILNSLH